MSEENKTPEAQVNIIVKNSSLIPESQFLDVISNPDAEMETNTSGEDRHDGITNSTLRIVAENPRGARVSFSELEETETKEWSKLAIGQVANRLETSLTLGLSSALQSKRLAELGINALDNDPRTPVIIIFLLQFYNLIVCMLLFAAIASMSFGEYVEGTAILIIVTINATVATYQENAACNALEALAQLSSPQCTIIQDGQQTVIDSKNLVPGCIVTLVTGDVVPADIRLFESVDLKVNEMLLTGESEDVSKKGQALPPSAIKGRSKLTADNMVFSSTTVTAGNAKGVVVETGMRTRVGSIEKLLKNKSPADDKYGDKKQKASYCSCLMQHQPKLTPLLGHYTN